MKYSKLFGKTVREAPADTTAVSHKLLYQAGFIRESTAGRYYFLPLGRRVHIKIMDIIREEMHKAGAQELVTPVMHPLDLWKETKRTDTANLELTQVKDRRGAKFVLGGTAEEMIVDAVRKFQLSYKDLPFNIYQFSTKFRDELRAKGGLLRVREFVMKDAYSFSKDEKEFKEEYDNMADAYFRIFKCLGLETKMVLADNGYIGGEYCHEFVMDSDVGESKYLESEDCLYSAHEDVAKFKREEINPKEKEKKFKIIKQPEWVQTMNDFKKHYKLPKSRFLKNVVYRNITSGEIVIGVIRGDLEVNRTKLEHVVDAVGQLEDATDEDLSKLGTKHGYVHSWGHKGVRYIGDLSLKTVKNFIGGQKEKTTDSFNVNYERDFKCKKLADIALAKAGYLTEDSKQKLVEKKGIEVGNIFQLGYHYSKKMKGAVFTDKDGKEKPYYMGCYGIGIGRNVATIVEKYHDDKGITWPISVAPYQVHLISLDDDKTIITKAKDLYNLLEDNNIEVLWDERTDVSAGVKFADADLIGIPIRIIVSKKSLSRDGAEIKLRSEQTATVVELNKILDVVRQKIEFLRRG